MELYAMKETEDNLRGKSMWKVRGEKVKKEIWDWSFSGSHV
jgi:hypothetical protein